MKLKALDVVKTSKGTLAVVNEVASDGRVSLVLPARSRQKIAWYEPEELTFVGTIADLAGAYIHSQVRQAGNIY
jgi:expansin (peptidoglycan-binding protein)